MSDLGTLYMRDGETYLRFERRFRQPVEKVWAALTEPDRVVQWWAEQTAFEPREGGDFGVAWSNGGPSAKGTITAIDPPRLLEHTLDWGGDGELFRFSWQLSETDDGGTLLVFEHNVPGEPERKNLSGWHTHFVMLEAALNGEPMEFSMDLWKEIDARYEAAYPDMELGYIPEGIGESA